MMRLLTLLLLSVISAFAADPIPTTRLPHGGTYQGIVGVDGGIPVRTTVFTNYGTSATAAQINAGIAACPSNQVVTLDAGTFGDLGATDILLAKSGVTVRGATDSGGNATTIFEFDSGANNVQFKADDWFTDVATGTARTISSGKTRGSTTVSLSAAPTGLGVGTLIVMSAAASGTDIDGDGDDFNFATTDPYYVMHKVTGVSGSDVSFEPAINADYLGTPTTRIHYKDFVDQVSRSGFENIIFRVASSGFFAGSCVDMDGTDSCWLYNCTLDGLNPTGSLNALLDGRLNFRVEVRKCTFTRASSNSSATYCIGLRGTSFGLIEDNIFHTIANVWPILGGGSTAFSYNMFDNQVYSTDVFLSQIVFLHGSHTSFGLFEGNWLAAHYNDGVADGNETHSGYQLYFREVVRGWDRYPNSGTGKTGNLHPFTFRNYHNAVTIAGCILGTVGKQTLYSETGATTGEPFAIYNIESTTAGMLIKTNNYNIVTAGVHSSEALVGSDALVNSYLYSSKPAWFGDRSWPWVDPQNPVSLATNSLAYTNFPAGYRYHFGEDPPAEAGGGGGNSGTVTLGGGTITKGGGTITF